MAQSHYAGGDPDALNRSQQRNIIHGAYYHRAIPYGYHDPNRHGLDLDYHERQPSYTMIQEQDAPTQEQQRRRIAVACTRCRRRKIKCTGDPGDGTGCTACKSSGADSSSCTFNRVQSQTVVMRGVEMLSSSPNIRQSSNVATCNNANDPNSGNYAPSRYATRSRASLPTLNTRSSFPSDHHTQYDPSPVDTYQYASSTIPRQDSIASGTYRVQDYRSWPSSTGPMSAPATTTYYEPYSNYSFGSVQAPFMPVQQQLGRLPSVTADSFAMGHLTSTLPAQTVHGRHLPIPAAHTMQYAPAPYTTAELQNIRPLGSFPEPRLPVNGIHSRSAMPWSVDSSMTSPRRGSMQTLAPFNGLPSSYSHSTSGMPEAVLGYQFSHGTSISGSDSPTISPTSGPAQSDNIPSGSGPSTIHGLPQPSMRYPGAPTYNLPAMTEYHRPSSSRSIPEVAAGASLYSFSTESSDSQSTTGESERNLYASRGLMAASVDYSTPTCYTGSSAGYDNSIYASSSVGGDTSYPPSLRHPQPQHATSIEALCRQPSFEQQQQQQPPSAASRMSIANVNSPYSN